jgi:hypothetical protein
MDFIEKKYLPILHNLCNCQMLEDKNSGKCEMDKSRRGFLKGGAALSLLAASGGLSTIGNAAFAQTMPTDDMMQTITNAFVTTNPAAFIHPDPTMITNRGGEEVGARLLCVFDASSSVSDAEYAVQLRATASAIRSQDFRDAIFFAGGPGSLSIAFMSFGSSCDIEIPWVDIREGDDAKLLRLADEVEGLGRRESGMTHHVKALFYAALCMQYCPWQGTRSIVDFMTDGKDNDNLQPREELIRGAVRQLGIDHRATVNALITVDPSSADADLEAWTNENIITPPGIVSADAQYVTPGFNQVVAFERSEETSRGIVLYERTMETAFKEKLIREVAGLTPDELNRVRDAGQQFTPPHIGPQNMTPPRYR